MSLGQMSHKQIVTWTKYYLLDAMIRCPLSCQFFHLDKCHQDKCHLDKCPLDKSYLANHAAQPSLIIRNTYFLLFLLLGPSVAMQSTWSPYLCMKMNICACGVIHALWLPDRGSVECATDRGSSAVGYTVPACPGSSGHKKAWSLAIFAVHTMGSENMLEIR